MGDGEDDPEEGESESEFAWEERGRGNGRLWVKLNGLRGWRTGDDADDFLSDQEVNHSGVDSPDEEVDGGFFFAVVAFEFASQSWVGLSEQEEGLEEGGWVFGGLTSGLEEEV
nr:hypothetical protein BaRGS_023730 [Batillaria attramentaria]